MWGAAEGKRVVTHLHRKIFRVESYSIVPKVPQQVETACIPSMEPFCSAMVTIKARKRTLAEDLEEAPHRQEAAPSEALESCSQARSDITSGFEESVSICC